MTGRDSQSTHFGHRCVSRYPHHLDTRHHGVGRAMLDEPDRPREQGLLLIIELAFLRGGAHDQFEFLERAEARQFFTWLDPEETNRPVGRRIEQANQRTEQSIDRGHGQTHP